MRACSFVWALFALVLLSSILSSASGVSVSASGTGRVVDAMNCLCSQMRALMPPLSMLLVVLAAVFYGAGKLFGSEMGSKTSAIAAFMLVAAVLSVLIAVAGPDVLRALYNDPAMTTACEASACSGGAVVTNAPPTTSASPSPAAAGGPRQALGCGAILKEPNRFYQLEADAISTQGASCITIEADNISLDCRGHLIKARTPQDGAGQYGISTNSTNTTIRNCRVQDFGYGLLLSASSNSSLFNNSVQSSISGGRALFIGQNREGWGSSDNVWVENNTLSGQAAALHIEYSSSARLIRNTLASDENTLSLLSSERDEIRSNHVSASNTLSALLAAGSNDNRLIENDFRSSGDGVRVVDSFSNRLESNNLSAAKTALAFSSEPGVRAENLVLLNHFLSGQVYVLNDGTQNYFNTTSNGRTVGNYYAKISPALLAPNSGLSYNQKTSDGKWLGSGEDWGPMQAY